MISNQQQEMAMDQFSWEQRWLPKRHFWDSGGSGLWSPNFPLRNLTESPDSRVLGIVVLSIYSQPIWKDISRLK